MTDNENTASTITLSREELEAIITKAVSKAKGPAAPIPGAPEELSAHGHPVSALDGFGRCHVDGCDKVEEAA